VAFMIKGWGGRPWVGSRSYLEIDEYAAKATVKMACRKGIMRVEQNWV